MTLYCLKKYYYFCYKKINGKNTKIRNFINRGDKLEFIQKGDVLYETTHNNTLLALTIETINNYFIQPRDWKIIRLRELIGK